MASQTPDVGTLGAARERAAGAWPPWFLLGVLVLGYIGIYLCRKNFSVANPLIRQAFGLSKEQIGEVASWSTLAYMAGKFAFGPVIDRIGGAGLSAGAVGGGGVRRGGGCCRFAAGADAGL